MNLLRRKNNLCGGTAVVAMVLSVLLCAAGPVRAQKTPTPALLPRDVALRFQTADLDHSGGLTQDEAIKGGFQSETFKAIDRDNDHIITLYEIGVYLTERARDWAAADRNGDGVVSKEEADASPAVKPLFSSADRDGDGVVRKEEYEAWSQTTLYQNVDLPVVVPNIINKKF